MRPLLLVLLAACGPDPIAGARGDDVDDAAGGRGGESADGGGGAGGGGGEAGCSIELGLGPADAWSREDHPWTPFTGGEIRAYETANGGLWLILDGRLRGFAGEPRDAWIRTELVAPDGTVLPYPFASCQPIDGEPAREQIWVILRGDARPDPPYLGRPLTLRVRTVSHADVLDCREPDDPAACEATIEVPVTIACCDPWN